MPSPNEMPVHDPDFEMIRMIDNGGRLGRDGNVYRPIMAPDQIDGKRQRTDDWCD